MTMAGRRSNNPGDLLRVATPTCPLGLEACLKQIANFRMHRSRMHKANTRPKSKYIGFVGLRAQGESDIPFRPKTERKNIVILL